MEIEIRHMLPASAERCWNVLFGPEYERAHTREAQVDIVVVEEGERGGRRYRRLRVTGREDLPRPVARALGAMRFSYDLEEVFFQDERRMEWRVVPLLLAGRVRAEGTYELVDAPGGCCRLVRGQIEVSIPLVGSRIEEAIAEQLKASYDRGAAFARRWLSERP